MTVLLLWLVSAFFFIPIFSSFFFQDDFLLLTRAMIHNPLDFFRLFVGQTDVIFYRPLSMGVFFWIAGAIFGKTYFWYKATTFLFYGVNIFLVSAIARRFADRRSSFLVAFLYAVHPAHFVALYWLAEINLVIGQAFFFGAILCALSRARVCSLVLFMCALLSNEFAVTLPFILFLLSIERKERWSHAIRRLVPFWVVLGAYGFLRIVVFPPTIAATYIPSFGPSIVRTFLWYLLRAFGLPETYSLRAALFARDPLEWGLAVTLVSLFIILVMSVVRRPRSRREIRPVMFGVLWFAVALLPVLFLHEHKLAAYVGFGLPGFALALTTVLQKRLAILFLVIYALFVFLGIHHQSIHHWVVWRAKISKDVLQRVEAQFPRGLPEKIFIADGPTWSSEHVYFSLVEDHGIQFWFSDLTVDVQYERWNTVPTKDAVLVRF